MPFKCPECSKTFMLDYNHAMHIKQKMCVDTDKKNKKVNLGQYYTTNYKYILKNMYIPDKIKDIIEPFTGNGDLLNFIDTNKYKIKSYDIDPKKNYTIRRDTLLNPPDYKDKFILFLTHLNVLYNPS